MDDWIEKQGFRVVDSIWQEMRLQFKEQGEEPSREVCRDVLLGPRRPDWIKWPRKER